MLPVAANSDPCSNGCKEYFSSRKGVVLGCLGRIREPDGSAKRDLKPYGSTFRHVMKSNDMNLLDYR